MTTPSFFQTARGARPLMALLLYGAVIRDANTELTTGNNQAPQAAQVTTIAIPASPDNDTDYSVTVNGSTATYTSDGSASQDEVGNGLVAAIQLVAGIRGICSPSYTGGVLTLTSIFPGVAFTASASGGAGGGAIGAATEATAAASASAIGFGKVLVSDGYVTDEGVKKVFVPSTSNLSAQVSTLTLTYASGEVYFVHITVRGQTYVMQAAGDTDTATTATALRAAINGSLPANTVIASGSAGTITLTAEVAGQGFTVAYGVVTGTAARLTLAQTTATALTDITRCLAGISVRRMDVENQTVNGDDPAYAANQGVEMLQRGRIAVQRDTSESPVPGDAFYLGTSGSEAGRLYKTASSTRVYIPAAFLSWERSERAADSDGVILVRLKAVA